MDLTTFFGCEENNYDRWEGDLTELKKKISLRFILAFIVVGAMLFLPAGSLYYWEAWIYLCVLFVPMFFVVSNFIKKDSELLER